VHGVFIPVPQQTMGSIDPDHYSNLGNSVKHRNLRVYTAPFSMGTTMLKLITLPFQFSIQIRDSSLCVIFQPCLCKCLDMLNELKLWSLL
jgi:hypothetical protein